MDSMDFNWFTKFFTYSSIQAKLIATFLAFSLFFVIRRLLLSFVYKFVEDTKVEYSKITWADRDTVIRATAIIIFIVIFTTLFIGTADISFTKGFFWLKSL